MRSILSLLLLGITAGCAHQAARSPSPQAADGRSASLSIDYSGYVASALAFDPPIGRTMPPMDLSREDRQPSAFAGYQQQTTTFTYTRTNDRQTNGRYDTYDRWSVTEQTGTSLR